MLATLRAEALKYRRSPLWLAFVALPVLSTIMGVVNFLGNQGILSMTWPSLWTQVTLFCALFFLPALLGTACAWAWRLEHTGHCMNQLMAAPISPVRIWLCKFSFAACFSLLAQLAIGALYLLAGRLIGLDGFGPAQLPGWLLMGFAGSLPLCAAQLLLSLIIRAFAVPVAMALAGGIAGLWMTANGWGLAFPYSLMALGMRANNPNLALDAPAFLLSCAAYTLLFAALCVLHLAVSDVRTA